MLNTYEVELSTFWYLHWNKVSIGFGMYYVKYGQYAMHRVTIRRAIKILGCVHFFHLFREPSTFWVIVLRPVISGIGCPAKGRRTLRFLCCAEKEAEGKDPLLMATLS